MGYEPQQDVYPPRQDQYNMQGQYTSAPMYTDNQYQQPLQQQPPQQDPIHPLPPVQPDPLPRALTQVQVNVNAVTPHPGATMSYFPRLTAPDLFHNTMCGCFKDFFTCKNIGICCCGCWCPCVLHSRTHYRLRARNPDDLNGFSYCNGQCWSSCCFGAPIHSRQRDEIRHRYRLNGSCCGDCLRHTCCSPCTLCQEEKEVIYREKELEELVKAANYQSAPQMVYPGQTKVQ